jgi:glycosyltransferase involved in cell wall biosynthesis
MPGLSDPAADTSRGAGPQTDLSERRLTIFIAHPSDLLTDHLPDGDGLVAFGFIEKLARRGHRLHIAVRRSALRGDLPSNVTLHQVDCGDADGVMSRLRYMAAIRRLLRRLQTVEPIAVVHQMNPVFAGLSLGLAGCGIPVVLGTFVARWPAERRQGGVRDALRDAAGGLVRWAIGAVHQAQASALLMTTPAAVNRIALPAWSRRKMFTVRHGINTDMFSPGEDWRERLRTGEPSILFYSHLDRRKGIHVLVEAFKFVAVTVPGSRLTIVGRGDHTEEVVRAVEATGLGDRIRITGPVERNTAPELFRAHSVYCLPSYGEPYATTVLEAMACARPVVVSDAGGLPYMLPKDGALRVPVGDPGALAVALTELLSSPERRVAMGSANLDFIRTHCTWDGVVAELEAVYARLLERRAARTRPGRSAPSQLGG